MSYKTAQELGIQQWEHDELVHMISFLPTVPLFTTLYNVSGRGFNMNETIAYPFNSDYVIDEDCGCVCCIGGWMAKHHFNNDYEARKYVGNMKGVLEPLFFPNRDNNLRFEVEYGAIEPEQAVLTIKHFLETGEVNWDRVIRDEQELVE